MKCSIIDRSTICFDHLATPLQHTVGQSLYATLIQVGPGPLCKMRWNSSKEVSSFTFLLAFCLMLSQRFSMGLQSGNLARSRTFGITSSGKPTRRPKNNTSLEEFQRILQRAWANLDQRRIQTLINRMLKRCREVIEADGGPINYWTLHSLWCLLKVKHTVACNKWCSKVQKHAWLSCYSCRSRHKSQKCNFFHTFCHKMHDFTPTMPSIGRHLP